jgi:rhodanese-related sulfurtransferase
MKAPGTGESVSRSTRGNTAGFWSQLRARAGGILGEGLIVAVIGIVFALAANGISPRGLKLARDYFPGANQAALPEASATSQSPASVDTNVTAPSAEEQLAARLQSKGLQLATTEQAEQLFRDPRYELELIVFIDARNDRQYREGHIPGAYQFNHYQPENHLATVLPVCQTAEQIVVYCGGGDCEDSEFAALFLRQAGIAAEKLLVYGGGMAEWTASGLPVEMGERHSESLRPANP